MALKTESFLTVLGSGKSTIKVPAGLVSASLFLLKHLKKCLIYSGLILTNVPGESLQERVRLMWAMPSQMPQEGAGRLLSLPLPSPSEGIWGETQAGAGGGAGPSPMVADGCLLAVCSRGLSWVCTCRG